VTSSLSTTEIDQRLAGIAVSATAPRQVVTITVGQYGQIKDLCFPSAAYRGMAPADLAEALLSTLRRAQAQAREEVAIVLASVSPPHFDASGADLTPLAEPDESGIFRRTAH
jgi:YbaB/EbfC DNA-binding family